jgi:hypothetical protein
VLLEGPLGESDLIEFISQFSELRCARYWFLSGFCCWKFKQIANIGFGRNNQLSPQCVHIVKFFLFSILKMWKIKNVFTLGLMTPATLVIIVNLWAKGIIYIIKEGGLFVCVVWLRSLKWWDPLSCSWYLVLLEIPWAVVCIEVSVW